jgi:hypothetical protein
MAAKFWPLDKKKGIRKARQQRRRNFSEELPSTPFLTTKRMKKFWKS